MIKFPNDSELCVGYSVQKEQPNKTPNDTEKQAPAGMIILNLTDQNAA